MASNRSLTYQGPDDTTSGQKHFIFLSYRNAKSSLLRNRIILCSQIGKSIGWKGCFLRSVLIYQGSLNKA